MSKYTAAVCLTCGSTCRQDAPERDEGTGLLLPLTGILTIRISKLRAALFRLEQRAERDGSHSSTQRAKYIRGVLEEDAKYEVEK